MWWHHQCQVRIALGHELEYEMAEMVSGVILCKDVKVIQQVRIALGHELEYEMAEMVSEVILCKVIRQQFFLKLGRWMISWVVVMSPGKEIASEDTT